MGFMSRAAPPAEGVGGVGGREKKSLLWIHPQTGLTLTFKRGRVAQLGTLAGFFSSTSTCVVFSAWIIATLLLNRTHHGPFWGPVSWECLVLEFLQKNNNQRFFC